MSNSISMRVGPIDNRCKWWAKVLRAGAPLPPAPEKIEGANSIYGAFLKAGEEELLPGDFLIHGEEVHHRHNRGWAYYLTYCNAEGQEVTFKRPGAEIKKQLKEAGMHAELLKGSGELAALVRVIHGICLGLI